jgi:hypothetical protein
MKQVLERLAMLQGMRDEMIESLDSIVDCESQAFREIDCAIRCLDDHHIHRLRVSLDLNQEIPLAQWLTAMSNKTMILTDEQARRLIDDAVKRLGAVRC